MSEDLKSNFEKEREDIQQRHRSVLDDFKKKSAEDKAKTLVHAGILTPELKLAPRYRATGEGDEEVAPSR